MKPFRLHEPTSAQEAVSLLSERGDTARLYAGGTELLLAMRSGLLVCDDLVNVKTVDGLRDIGVDDGTLVIGAAATHREIEFSPVVREHFPLLAEVEHLVANVRVRNTGTLAGNLCFADPHSDPATLLLLYDAEVEIAGPSSSRRIRLADLQVGPYETALAADEMVVRVRVPSAPRGAADAYRKFGLHQRPTIGVGAMLRVEDGVLSDVRLSLGCVSPVPRRLPDAEAVLMGERVDALSEGSSVVSEAGRLAAAAADAVDDLHGRADYKEHLVGVLAGRVLSDALSRLGAS